MIQADTNPYRELIVNNAERVYTILSQMEQWSILSNKVNYMQYNRYTKNFHNLNITAVNNVNHRSKPNRVLCMAVLSYLHFLTCVCLGV